MESVETAGPRQLIWPNAIVILGLPPAALAAAIWCVGARGFAPPEAAAFLVTYFLTGISITAGYHRYYSHRAYDCARPIQFLFLVFGAATLEHPLIRWASDHRFHHRHTDAPGDPHAITEGFFHAHMGWILRDRPSEERKYPNVEELKKDRLVQWQDDWFGPIFLCAGIGLPALFGVSSGRVIPCLVWGGLVRIVFVHHGTFLINSLAHWSGSRGHDATSSARDNPWLALITFGEGYHNFHHAFPSDYRNGTRWYDFDPSKWIIRALAFLGLAWNLKTPSERSDA